MSLSSLNESRNNKNRKISTTGVNLGSPFLCDVNQVLKQVELSLFLKRGFSLFTLNLDHLSQMTADKEFEKVYGSATLLRLMAGRLYGSRDALTCESVR